MSISAIGRSRMLFGFGVGVLLAALLSMATQFGSAAAPLLPPTEERTAFSSYVMAQLVWVVAVVMGGLGYLTSRLARKLPASRAARIWELIALAALAASLLILSTPAALLLGILITTYCIGRWLEIHPVAAQRPDRFVLVSLAAGFALVYWRTSV